MIKKYALMLIILFAQNVQAESLNPITIYGTVQLDDTTDYGGVQITFDLISPQISSNETISMQDGSFSVSIYSGVYNIVFEIDGWKPLTLYGEILADDNYDLGIVNMEVGYAVYVSGHVSGVWTSLNDYYVEGVVGKIPG